MRIKVLIVLISLICLIPVSTQLRADNMDIGLGLWGLDFAYVFSDLPLITDQDILRLVFGLGYYTDYFFDVQDLTYQFAEPVNSTLTDYISSKYLIAKFHSIYSISFNNMFFFHFIAKTDYYYYLPSEINDNYMHQANCIDAENGLQTDFAFSFDIMFYEPDKSIYQSRYFLDFEFTYNYYPAFFQFPGYLNDIHRLNFLVRDSAIIFKNEMIKFSFHNQLVLDWLLGDNIPAFLYNSYEGGFLLSKMYNKLKRIDSAVRGINAYSYGSFFESKEKYFVNTDLRITLNPDSFITYGVIFYYDLVGNNFHGFEQFYHSAGLGFFADVIGMALVVYMNYFFDAEDLNFTVSLGYQL